jgi:transposase
MAAATEDFASWLAQAEIPQSRLTPQVEAVLRAVWHFRQEQGSDYYSTRLLSHFLLHCDSGLKVAQVARLVGVSRPTASEQQGLSSKQVIQQAHHRLKGRPYGKLLPRFAGPIAAFLHARPDASRKDLLGFIAATFGVKVSRIALYKFLKKYGLDHPWAPAAAQPAGPLVPADASAGQATPPLALPPAPAKGPALVPLPAQPPPFSSGGRSTPAPSC